MEALPNPLCDEETVELSRSELSTYYFGRRVIRVSFDAAAMINAAGWVLFAYVIAIFIESALQKSDHVLALPIPFALSGALVGFCVADGTEDTSFDD